MSQQYTAEEQRTRIRRAVVSMAVIIILLIVICGLAVMLIRDSFSGRNEPRAVLDGATITSLAEFSEEDAHPKDVTVGPDGNLYVSGFCSGKIWQITPDGDVTTWYDGAEVGAAGGLAFTSTGELYIVDRGDCDPRQGTASLKRISADGQSIETIDGIDKNDLPDFLAVDKNDILYFTDNQNGAVYTLGADGKIHTWWDMPETNDQEPLPTGIVYDPENDVLYIAETNSGTIFRIGFDPERKALLPQEVIYQNDEREIDGLTLDGDGNVVMTLINVHKVAHVVDGQSLVIGEDFRQPSGVAYLDNTIYVANFDGVSLAPLVGFFISPSLPFTVDAIHLPQTEPIATETVED